MDPGCSLELDTVADPLGSVRPYGLFWPGATKPGSVAVDAPVQGLERIHLLLELHLVSQVGGDVHE